MATCLVWAGIFHCEQKCIKIQASYPRARIANWLPCSGESHGKFKGNIIEWCKHMNPNANTKDTPESKRICGQLQILSGMPLGQKVENPQYILQHESCHENHLARPPGFVGSKKDEHDVKYQMRVGYGCILYMLEKDMFQLYALGDIPIVLNAQRRSQYHILSSVVENDTKMDIVTYTQGSHLALADEICRTEYEEWHAQWYDEQRAKLNAGQATDIAEGSGDGVQASGSGVQASGSGVQASGSSIQAPQHLENRQGGYGAQGTRHTQSTAYGQDAPQHVDDWQGGYGAQGTRHTQSTGYGQDAPQHVDNWQRAPEYGAQGTRHTQRAGYGQDDPQHVDDWQKAPGYGAQGTRHTQSTQYGQDAPQHVDNWLGTPAGHSTQSGQAREAKKRRVREKSAQSEESTGSRRSERPRRLR
ncbi:hypothetical protein BT63DRAFT_459366 [Microthyrium microscopicum]|uniref:Uncharacterized protein n=1 Tax=Microthyrium microscopicum TaxID=703497 RepID=A0A6A6U3T6_9PEZI|nr:hypothetical protein BT63DRAFT_459366 [Microthyrium microscopicum]